MTIQNERAYLDGVWDWAILDGCFGDTKISPTDLDGWLERNGHFLILEAKSPGVIVKKGQEIMFKRAVETGFFTVMVVWGPQNKPEKLQVCGSLGDCLIDPCDLATFRRYVSEWFSMANSQKPGITKTPLLTRKVVAMFEELRSEVAVNNRLLLQLLDQTKAVKPIRRGNVVSINGSLFEEQA